MSHPTYHEDDALLPAEAPLPVEDEDQDTGSAAARVGQTIRGRWHLDALLGVGGMAAVYAATHRNGLRVAVKLMHAELSTNPELKQRFLDEGYAANRVGHRAAVSVLDDGVSEEGSVYLVMDLLEGETLETRIRRDGHLPPNEVLLVVDELLDVLAAAHDKEIIHRDVKPDNIFITQKGVAKLLDFGIARMIKPGRARTTQTGAAMGTPAFMPPEQARGHWEPLDGRTDIWAVGATMFYALTGRQVHEGTTSNEELVLAMTERAPSLGEIAPHLGPLLAGIVDRALIFEKEDRWPSAREMQAAVREAALAASWAMTIAGDAPGPVEGKRPSRLPVESPAPVALISPSAVVSRISRPPPMPLPRGVRVGVPAAAVLLGLAIIVLLLGRNTQLAGADTLAKSPAGSTPSLEATATAPEPTEAPTFPGEALFPSETALAEPEPDKPSEQRPARVKAARGPNLDNAPARGPVASPPGSTIQGSPPPGPVPPAADPLGRRK
jgi:eukaryotic-like serine/threonine-protein kinase